MQVKIMLVSGPEWVERACAITAGREARDALDIVGQWRELLQAEHSPVRCLMLWVELRGISSFCSVHLVRHHVGTEHFVKSQQVNPERGKAPQDALVNHAIMLNAQAMLNISRRRLCGKAGAKTREVWEAVRDVALIHEHPAVRVLAEFMVPMCVYRDRCPERTGCSIWMEYSDKLPDAMETEPFLWERK